MSATAHIGDRDATTVRATLAFTSSERCRDEYATATLAVSG